MTHALNRGLVAAAALMTLSATVLAPTAAAAGPSESAAARVVEQSVSFTVA